MTIPELKDQYRRGIELRQSRLKQTTGRYEEILNREIGLINAFILDLDKLECNGKAIDYLRETCTSCGCKNHDQ